MRSGMTGAEAAAAVVRHSGLTGVTIERHQGFLSDHYDPRHKVLRLSPDNYRGTSLAAVGVAAHEAGHAIQHAQKYAMLTLRNMAVPVANLGSSLGWIVLVIGLLCQFGLFFGKRTRCGPQPARGVIPFTLSTELLPKKSPNHELK